MMQNESNDLFFMILLTTLVCLKCTIRFQIKVLKNTSTAKENADHLVGLQVLQGAALSAKIRLQGSWAWVASNCIACILHLSQFSLDGPVKIYLSKQNLQTFFLSADRYWFEIRLFTDSNVYAHTGWKFDDQNALEIW